MSKEIGIWVSKEPKVSGWLEEEDLTPTTFKSIADAKKWIRDNAVHSEYYEPKEFKKGNKWNKK